MCQADTKTSDSACNKMQSMPQPDLFNGSVRISGHEGDDAIGYINAYTFMRISRISMARCLLLSRRTAKRLRKKAGEKRHKDAKTDFRRMGK